MGIRYRPVLPPAALENLPSAARTLADTFLTARQRADRGLVRGKNDRTLDNRAARFRDWLFQSAGFRDFHFENLRVDSAQLVLASYVGQLQKVTMRKTGRPPAPKTLMMHLNAACLFLEQATGLTIPLKETTGDKHPKLLDIFADIFSLSQKCAERTKGKTRGIHMENLQSLAGDGSGGNRGGHHLFPRSRRNSV